MTTGITGAHILLNSANPEEDRGFFRDVLGFRSVDVGGGWLIFKLPPAEIAVHPSDGKPGKVHAGHALSGAVLYLMCDDLKATIKSLKARKIKCTEVSKERWGIKTTVQLPSGGEIGLYQPSHETALDL